MTILYTLAPSWVGLCEINMLLFTMSQKYLSYIIIIIIRFGHYVRYGVPSHSHIPEGQVMMHHYVFPTNFKVYIVYPTEVCPARDKRVLDSLNNLTM